MATAPSGGKSATVSFNPHNQTLDTVRHVIETILGRAGCGTCGRLAILKIDLQGDPAELQKQGVISLHTEGF